MKYDFLKQKFVYESANKTPDQNKVELDAMQMTAVLQPTFTVTDDHIEGTRTSALIFTPTVSEAWTVDDLIDKYAVAFVSTDTATFSAHKIGDNDATSLTIDATYGDATLLAACDRVVIFDSWVDALESCTFEAKDDSVDVTGDLAVSGSIDIQGAAGLTFSNDETITNDVNGEVLVTGNIAATGSADIRGAGGIIMENDDTITNTVAGTIVVTGSLDVTVGLDVQGGDITLENDEIISNGTNGQIDAVGNFGVKPGTTGAWVTKISETTATLSGATTDIDVDVPTGAVLIGTQLRVDTLIASGDGATSWEALYKTGATQAITTAQAFTKNTKVNTPFDANAATAITSNVTKITINPNSNTFSAGVIRAITYYQEFEAMNDAA